MMSIHVLSEESAPISAMLLNRGQLLKERICSYRSKFFPVRVDPILKSYLTGIQRNKQEFIQVNVVYEKRVRGVYQSRGVY